LPVLLRLWRGRGTASPVQLARELILLLAQEFPDRCIHAVGDAAYHGKALLVERTTVTTRGPANAALYAPAPPGTGRPGRPRLTGHRLGTPTEIAAAATWRQVTVSRYGRRDTVEITVIDAIWYGAFGNTEGRTVLVREPGSEKVMAIFTTDTTSDTETVVARYADRWPIEVAIAGGKQLLGIGQARNRLQRAVERTVPLSFCVYSSSWSGTRCTATSPTTSPAAAPISPGTRTRTTSPSKTCSPSFAEALSQHELRALTQLSPIPVNTATTNWPARQPPRNCESQVLCWLGICESVAFPERPVRFGPMTQV
jgi:hypothetical protein